MQTSIGSPLEHRGPPPVKLALARPFALGQLDVQPATCRVARDDESESIEPRVMQVLVALVEANGEVVSRDDLVARCWEGRVVGENAINRVISRLRALGAGLGAGCFEVETITKVGYRLVVARTQSLAEPVSLAVPSVPATPATPTGPQAPGRPPEPRRPLRRRLLAATAVAAAGGVAAAGWWRAVNAPSSEALALYRKGVEAQRQGLVEQNVQAAAYFRQAVARDAGYADAWGALALAYRHLLETGRVEDDPPTTAAWVRSAAANALRLDPRNADAQVALILIKPYFRHWTAIEREVRAALDQYPGHWLLWSNLGRVLGEVGRWGEALEPIERAVALDPFLPIARGRQAVALWSSGRMQQAQAAFDAASTRWPAHPSIWFPKLDFLALSGQSQAALAMLAQSETRPVGAPHELFESYATLARMLGSGGLPEHTSASEVDLATRSLSTPSAVLYLAAFERLDEAFGRLDRYFFGSAVSPVGQLPKPGPLTRRYTDFLFMPPTAALRADRRFGPLTAALGLDAYWRAAGAEPDHRR